MWINSITSNVSMFARTSFWIELKKKSEHTKKKFTRKRAVNIISLTSTIGSSGQWCTFFYWSCRVLGSGVECVLMFSHNISCLAKCTTQHVQTPWTQNPAKLHKANPSASLHNPNKLPFVNGRLQIVAQIATSGHSKKNSLRKCSLNCVQYIKLVTLCFVC